MPHVAEYQVTPRGTQATYRARTHSVLQGYSLDCNALKPLPLTWIPPSDMRATNYMDTTRVPSINKFQPVFNGRKKCFHLLVLWRKFSQLNEVLTDPPESVAVIIRTKCSFVSRSKLCVTRSSPAADRVKAPSSLPAASAYASLLLRPWSSSLATTCGRGPCVPWMRGKPTQRRPQSKMFQ